MAMNENPGAPPPSPSPDEGDDERLACGRELAEVWEHWETGRPDPHAADCPHCTAALRDLDLLGDFVRTEREAAPEEYDTAGLTARVMDVVRLELRPGRTLPLGEPDEDTWIVEAAAARTVRAAAEAEPGVRAGSCRISPGAGAGAGAGTDARAVAGSDRGPVTVRLEVVVPLSPHLPEIADRVRERVLVAADSVLGLRLAAVDVVITDITESVDSADAEAADTAGARTPTEDTEDTADTEGPQR